MYFVTLDNQVAVDAQSEEAAREVAITTFIEILQREKDVILVVETEDY
jgi:hypothetical protein